MIGSVPQVAAPFPLPTALADSGAAVFVGADMIFYVASLGTTFFHTSHTRKSYLH